MYKFSWHVLWSFDFTCRMHIDRAKGIPFCIFPCPKWKSPDFHFSFAKTVNASDRNEQKLLLFRHPQSACMSHFISQTFPFVRVWKWFIHVYVFTVPNINIVCVCVFLYLLMDVLLHYVCQCMNLSKASKASWWSMSVVFVRDGWGKACLMTMMRWKKSAITCILSWMWAIRDCNILKGYTRDEDAWRMNNQKCTGKVIRWRWTHPGVTELYWKGKW